MLQIKKLLTGKSLLLVSMLLSVSVPAYAENSPEANLANWSKQMSQAMNLKMENKIEQIVMKAQHMHQLAMDSRNLLTAVDKKIDCETENKISKIKGSSG
ncbi:MAG: hypothetical protein GY744_15230 [Gammaproteobacteria bacterium]|nr:hypothetical protein [Gammaproteobacteria bacterium]